MMGTSRVFLPALLMALAATAAGCADHPAAVGQRHGTAAAASASSTLTRYGVSRRVLEQAANLGYAPRKIKGETVFCQSESETGSMISRYRCVDAATLTAKVQSRRRTVRGMERSNSGCYRTPCSGP